MASRPRLAQQTAHADAEQTVTPAEWFTSATNLSPRRMTWLWPGRILQGSVAVLEGRKGVGKTSLCAAIAAAVSGGTKLHGRRKSPARGVIWIPGEDDASAYIRPRLIAAGADLDEVHFPGEDNSGLERRLMLPLHLTLLTDAIEALGIGLVILDPLRGVVPQDVRLIDEQDIGTLLDHLGRVARQQQCTFLITRNLTKNRSADRLDQGLGSAAIGNSARSVLCIDWPDRRDDRRVLRVIACNQGSRTAALEYILADSEGVPVMDKVKEVGSADDDLDADQADAGERDTRADARILLRRVIGEEWVCAAAIVRESSSASISERTLRSVKAELCVRSRRVGSASPAYWEWGPPVGGWK